MESHGVNTVRVIGDEVLMGGSFDGSARARTNLARLAR